MMADRDAALAGLLAVREAAQRFIAALDVYRHDELRNAYLDDDGEVGDKGFDEAEQSLRAASPSPLPTWADEPPWGGWFSCEDCNGWFNAAPVCFDSGSEVCDGCAEKREPASPAVPLVEAWAVLLAEAELGEPGGVCVWHVEQAEVLLRSPALLALCARTLSEREGKDE